MALKRKIDKETFDALPKDVQKVYTKEGEDYLLDLEGMDDVDELRRAKDREAENAKQLRKDIKAAKDRVKELEDAAAEGDPAKANDIKKLDAAHKAELKKIADESAEREAALATKLATKDAQTKASMINAAASALANKISTAPAIFADTIAKRLSVDLEGDEPKLVILNKDGKPSAMTMEQLSKELVANKDYASIIVASKASGSGAPRNGLPPKPPSGTSESSEQGDLSKMTPKALAEHLKAQKEAASNQ